MEKLYLFHPRLSMLAADQNGAYVSPQWQKSKLKSKLMVGRLTWGIFGSSESFRSLARARTSSLFSCKCSLFISCTQHFMLWFQWVSNGYLLKLCVDQVISWFKGFEIFIQIIPYLSEIGLNRDKLKHPLRSIVLW